MSNQALLVMDMQASIVDRYGEDAQRALDIANLASSAARTRGIPVIFVRVAFRDGAPEVSARNKVFVAHVETGQKADSNPASQIHPSISVEENDIIVTKRRVSAFSGSDLDVVLRSLDVTSLVLMGIATRGVVLSTVRQAADLDFEITVLRDGCVDLDAEVQRILMNVIFPRQSKVVLTEDWIASVEA